MERPCQFKGCPKFIGKHGSHGLCTGHASQFRAGKRLTQLNTREARPPVPHPTLTEVMLVPLTQGYFALIDSVDAIAVGNRCWSIRKSKRSRILYAQARTVRPDGSVTMIKLHRFLWLHWGLPDAPEIDHKNTDGLDCRRENLRAATKSQNSANRSMQNNNTSGLKGVSRHSEGKWQAHITCNKKIHCLGIFDNKEAAGLAYKNAARALNGEFARTEP